MDFACRVCLVYRCPGLVAAWEWARMGGIRCAGWASGICVGDRALLPLGTFLPPTLVLLTAFVGWTAATWLVVTWPTFKAFWTNSLLRVCWPVYCCCRRPGWHCFTFEPQPGRWGTEVPGVLLILYVFLIVWCADIGAYFRRQAMGRQLAPLVSPGKSIEGATGGLVAVSSIAICMRRLGWAGLSSTLLLWLVSLITAAYSIVGDLLESLAKASGRIKDSSQILPGHGGIMDRIDSVTAAAPFFVSFWCCSVGCPPLQELLDASKRRSVRRYGGPLGKAHWTSWRVILNNFNCWRFQLIIIWMRWSVSANGFPALRSVSSEQPCGELRALS